MNTIETHQAPPALLYVEDEENDVFFMRRAIERAGIVIDFQSVCDGDKAVAYLAGEGAYAGRRLPRLVLLDLNLPLRSGFEVLEWLRGRPELGDVHVVVFSSSGRPEDRERAQLLSADDYILKPTSGIAKMDIARELWRRWLDPQAPASVAT